MFKRIKKRNHKCRQAFTLVELIVVLVVLAILAAILVPALTGYIKRTKKEKYYENLYCARVAAQSVMTELYGLADGNASSSETDDGNNVLWNTGSDKSWGDKVLKLMDCGRGKDNGEPYVLIVGVGSHKEGSGMSLAQKYTVYYVCYIQDDNAPAVFYINGDYFYKYPRKDGGKVMATYNGFRNSIVYKNANIPLQFYIISNRSGMDANKSSFWTGSDKRSILSHCDKQYA